MHELGGCQVGWITDAFDGERKHGAEPSALHCSGKVCCLWFASREQVRRHAPPGAMSTDALHRPVLEHHFCPICGGSAFGFGRAAHEPAHAAIEPRRRQTLDLATPRAQLDGRRR
ncbi:hypothetical protein OPU71_04280 [Niveibacterium sp. 24ML]|uniref:hypothetical protein n=1 Tax=Niveibacterium sp. 24ML TaxID=2985512 RepID=UPI00226F27C6|nr:hypothetical protein [Niveibacterium sp. 24ML]MCX9155335.1 hypothetical protein [Niveibacterium sp. 24ML]